MWQCRRPSREIVLHPVRQVGQSRLALAQFVEQVRADMRGMGAARKAARAPPRCCADPRRTSAARSARRRAGCGTTSRRHSASRAASRRASWSTSRPTLPEKPIRPNTLVAGASAMASRGQLLHVLVDRLERGGALAGQDLVEDGDLALLARRRARRQLARARERRLGFVAAPQKLLGAGERDVAERKPLVGRHRRLEGRVHPGRGRHQAFDTRQVGIASGGRSRAQVVAVAILQHAHAFLLARRRIPHRRGHRLAEILEHQVERDADALALAVVGRHRVLQPGREDHQPAFLALGVGAVGGEPRVLPRLGHDHRGLAARVLEQDLRAGRAGSPRSRRRSGSCSDDGASGGRRRAD